MTKIGVCSCSARSNASLAIVKHSSTEPGNSMDVLGVAVRESVATKDVALRGARRQSGGRPDALDVPDHARNFGVVAQAGELRHQRDSGSGGRGHGARASPACAQHHADRREFILGLHDGESGLAIRADAIFLHVIDERFSTSDDDGVIGYQVTTVTPANMQPMRSRGVAVDDDLAGGLVHPLDRERVRLGQRGRRRNRSPALAAFQFRSAALTFLRELLAQGLLHLGHVEARAAARRRRRRPCS